MPSPVSPGSYALIDDPGPFASLGEWREFLADLESGPRTPQIDRAIADAREAIAALEAAGER